jgi:hypothetical protein
MTSYTGGCSCGAVRFAIRDYLYALVCHCDACKKRTGSAFGISVVVENADILELRGALQTYTRIAESKRPVDYEFCPLCATTIRWTIKKFPNRKIFAGGAFDDMRLFPAAGEMYNECALDWARPRCALSRSGEPDAEFGAALIARAKELR